MCRPGSGRNPRTGSPAELLRSAARGAAGTYPRAQEMSNHRQVRLNQKFTTMSRLPKCLQH
jgi:hypothetical protein